MAKTALITGASRGIGAAIATGFAKEGYSLSICCMHSEEALLQFAEELRQTFHIQVLPFVGDVGDFSFVEHMTAQTLGQFGHIDVLVNNAGISHIGLLSDMTVEEWNRLLAVNLTSVFSTCKCVVPSMVQRRSGHIINISSVWGNVGTSCEVAYSASKGGINAFTRALAKELAPSHIQVNAIACGVIDTAMNAGFSPEERSSLAEEIPAGYFAAPEEVARFAVQLKDSPDYLTGQIITLDGGWT